MIAVYRSDRSRLYFAVAFVPGCHTSTACCCTGYKIYRALSRFALTVEDYNITTVFVVEENRLPFFRFGGAEYNNYSIGASSVAVSKGFTDVIAHGIGLSMMWHSNSNNSIQ